MHTVLNPTAETNLAFAYHFLRVLFMALGVCKRCAELQNFPLHVLFIAHQAWRIRSNGAQQIQTAMNFSTTRGRMVSIPFNALSEASSMSFTYPPTTKLSPLFTAAFVCNPSTQKQKKNSPLFNKRLCSPSLCVNHRCRHCGTIHSQVSLIPWSFIKVIMCLYLTVSVCFVYWTMSVWSALCGVVFVLILGLLVWTSSSDEIQ